MANMSNCEFFASVAKGAEDALHAELRELEFRDLSPMNGGVYFHGPREEGWRACLWSRIAQRVFLCIHEYPAATPEALYAGARAIEWHRVLTPDRTLNVSVVSRSSVITHTDFAALKTKDAIVDALREHFGTRPSVARTDADVNVFVRLFRDVATVYLDLAGDALFRRGYRQTGHEAPLKETLAAAMIRLSGWDRQQTLLDPMCGSGTLAIEAAQWATNIAPGLLRPRFGFERWADFGPDEAAQLVELRGEARRAKHGQAPRIIASDLDPQAVAAATANARLAGVRISLREAGLAELQAGGTPGIVVTNPPYGQRLAADSAFYREMGSALTRLHGWRVALLAGSRDVAYAMPLKPTASYPLFNGDIECRFLMYDVP